MDAESLQYSLSAENIASEPAEVRLGRRDLGRMLVVDRAHGEVHHSSMQAFPEWLRPGDVLVLNDCKRLPGVLHGRTMEGAQVELRFVRIDESEGICRIYPSHAVQTGTVIHVARSDDSLTITAEGLTPHSLFHVRGTRALRETLLTAGLPITSFFYGSYWDLENYNNCFASEEGSVESPMAGLHFTPELLGRVAERGVQIVYITLHPVGSWLSSADSAGSALSLLSEPYRIPSETADAIRASRQNGRRVIACGTTVVRALESAAKDDGAIEAGTGATTLRIGPGFVFRSVDAYFTNFHPSSSSLMMLDAAFCERELLLSAYHQARDAGYLFYEFGDAIFYV